MFTLTFDPAVDANTQAYAEGLVRDYLNARQEAVNLATLRGASPQVKAQVQALLDEEKAKIDATAEESEVQG